MTIPLAPLSLPLSPSLKTLSRAILHSHSLTSLPTHNMRVLSVRKIDLSSFLSLSLLLVSGYFKQRFRMKLTRKTLLELLNEYFDIVFLTMSADQKLLKFKASS